VIRYGPDASSDALRRNFTCTKCGHRGDEITAEWIERFKARIAELEEIAEKYGTESP
jgi:hypothetical protein